MKKALILSGGGARGAFQAGVWRFLSEREWTPDLICGSSVGAINAAAIASGLSAASLQTLWESIDRRRMYRPRLGQFFRSVIGRRPFSPPFDTDPLRHFLEAHIDLTALRKSRTEIIITAVNVQTGRLRYFGRNEITVDHLLASGAVPMISPWQVIDGEAYWDGGVMANTPILPALQRNAESIITVLMSPVGTTSQRLPKTALEAARIAFEQILNGSYETLLSRVPETGAARSPETTPEYRTVAPDRMLGFRSLMDYSPRQARKIFRMGYECAKRQLPDLP